VNHFSAELCFCNQEKTEDNDQCMYYTFRHVMLCWAPKSKTFIFPTYMTLGEMSDSCIILRMLLYPSSVLCPKNMK
jgi:hypothetical protein